MSHCPSPQLVLDFLTGKAPPMERQAVEHHLSHCMSCQGLADKAGDDSEVRKLYQSHRESGSQANGDNPPAAGPGMSDVDFTETRTVGNDRVGEYRDVHPRTLGRYHLFERLGAGGSGVVYRAQDEQLGRPVALKLRRASALIDGESRTRFFREAKAAAGLHHPQIVALYDAGEHDGVCYLASAYCPGSTLARWLAERDGPASPDDAAQIVLALALGVQHAHENRVLHRDIKPQNVLLDPTVQFHHLPFSPKLTDFSIAKLIDGEGTQTATEVLLGTPRYMAPELVAGRRDQLGPACDIYALGVILYELVAGRTPIEGTSQVDTLRRVLSDEPVQPRKWVPAIPRDLEAICLTCLEKRPERRYGSAAGLAEDLQRFLRRQPTIARPLGPHERMYRWVRGRPAAAGLVAVSVFASLVLMAGLATYNTRLGTLNLDLLQSNTNLERALDEAKRAKGRAEASESQTQQLLYVSDMRLAGRAWKEADLPAMHELLRRHSPLANQPDRRGLEWHFLHNLTLVKANTLAELPAPIYQLQRAPDGRRVAAVGADAVVRLYNPNTGSLERSIPTGQRETNGVSFSPDGSRLATAGDDGTVRVWSLDEGRELFAIDAHPHLAFQVYFTRDGNQLISCGDDPLIRVWDAAAGNPQSSLEGNSGTVEAVAVSPNGQWLASVSSDTSIRFWSLADRRGSLVFGQTPEYGFNAVAFSPDSSWFATVDSNRHVRIWDSHTHREIATGDHLDPVHSVAVSPDGRYVASGDRAGIVSLWQIEPIFTPSGPANRPYAMKPAQQWRAHDGRIYTLLFHENDRLISAGKDKRIRAWRVSSISPPRMVRSAADDLAHFAFTSSGQLVAVQRFSGLVANDSADPTTFQPCPSPPGEVRLLCVDRAGTLLATLDQAGIVHLWDLQGGRSATHAESTTPNASSTTLWKLQAAWCIGAEQDVRSLALSPDGKALAIVTLGPRRELSLYDARSGTLRTTFELPFASVGALAFSPNGEQIALKADDDVMIWSVEQARNGVSTDPRRLVHCHTNLIHLAYSPDGSLLATCGSDRLVKFWDPNSGLLLATLSGQRGTINSMCFSGDGRSLVTASTDGALKVWSVAAREELFDLHQNDEPLSDVRISPDGRWLACTTSRNAKLLLFDLTAPAP